MKIHPFPRWDLKYAVLTRILLLAVSAFLFIPPAHATDYHWTGSVDDDYGNSGNWSPATVPGNTDRASFANGTYAVASAVDRDVNEFYTAGNTHLTVDFGGNVYTMKGLNFGSFYDNIDVTFKNGTYTVTTDPIYLDCWGSVGKTVVFDDHATFNVDVTYLFVGDGGDIGSGSGTSTMIVRGGQHVVEIRLRGHFGREQRE